MDDATKTGLDAEATGEFTGNKTAHKIIKPKLVSYENSRNVE